jgi:hypothetical protein
MQAAVAPSHRQFNRRPVAINAFVHSRGRFQRARILDYSAGGLHVTGTFGLVKMDPVEIELMSGTRVCGSVAWSLGAHTGIVFSQPLAVAGPAMAELSGGAGMKAIRAR